MKLTTAQRGSAFLLTLFFSSLFIIMFGATLSFVLVQHKAVEQELWNTQAVYIAESGAHYYRWHLAHDPDEFVADTGVHMYTDPQGGDFGSYDITVAAPPSGSTTATITVGGAPIDQLDNQKRVRVRYGQPSLAHYAFLTNSNVWFGETETIHGEMHSNGGVRMDGIGDSLLTSAVETYICGVEHGCANQEEPGVWGNGVDPQFWEYPVDSIDFNDLLLNLEDLETISLNGGLHLPDSGAHGYYIQFNANGTLTVNTVTSVYPPVNGYNGSQWVRESNDKKTWTPVPGYQNIALPANGMLFAADDVWVDGQVNGRVTVVAARLPDGSYERADIYIQNDITYVDMDGSDVLGLIAQQDILVPLRVDTDLDIHAALLATNGHVIRYFYPNYYGQYALRDIIETYGTIITNTIWTWSWVSIDESDVIISGFEETVTTYDPNLTYGPPPAFPTEDEYVFISWEQLTQDEP